MAHYKDTLAQLHNNLNTLREREAKYGGNAPLDLLNQISDHQTAIALTRQAIASEISEAEWREALRPLNIDHTLIEGGFFQKIIQALSLPTEQQRELRNRQIMLQRVHDFWVKGVLENSLCNEVLIELGMEERKEAVEYPWKMVIQRPSHPNRQLPPGTKIIDVFDESGGSLLILGEPGSGKTTMLLELARQLIVRAQADPSQPIPVVFNLSSWAEKRLPLVEWLVEELNRKYQIPKKIAQPWIGENELLLLLDGLDEVAKQYRIACVESINAFQKSNLITIAICSRVADYEALGTQLKLQYAVLLQPLSLVQIEKYLATVGSKLETLRIIIQRNSDFQEIAASPLMLNIMTVAYQSVDFATLVRTKFNTLEDQQKRLFNLYIERMFKRRISSKNKPFLTKQTIHRLTWLAQKMCEHGQTVFLVELTQPNWLSSRGNLIFAFGCGLSVGLIILLIARLGHPSSMQFYVNIAMLTGLFFGFMSYFGEIKPTERLMWSWKNAGRGLISGVKLALEPALGLVKGLPWFGLFGLVAGLTYKWSTEPEPLSLLWWALMFGGVFMAMGLFLALSIVVFALIVSPLYGGVSQVEIGTRMGSNQSIWRSATGPVMGGLLGGLIFGLIIGLGGGLRPGLTLGLIFGLVFWLIEGGFAFIQHFILRLILYHNGYIPWNLIPFLDYCVERIFLRKVGGGYIFIHRHLMEYFASLTSEDIERLSTEIEPKKVQPA